MSTGRKQTNANLDEPLPNSILVQVLSSVQTIYVQSIRYSPTDFSSGTVLNFIDSLTLRVIGQINVLPMAINGITQYILDFGIDGTALTLGASLQLSVVSGGATGRLLVRAYQSPPYVMAAYVAPKTAGFTA